MKKEFSFILDIIKTQKTTKSGDKIVYGYASTYDVDSDDVQITHDALEGAKDDLIEYNTVLFNHNPDRPIGLIIETDVDDVGLLVKVKISNDESEIWKKIEEGIINKFSINGRIVEMTQVEGLNEIFQINKLKLFEVSLVSVPANKKAATISHYVAKSMNITKTAEPEQKETSNNIDNMDIIEKLKNIIENKPADIKKEIETVIKEYSSKSELLEKLQIAAGKLADDDKEAVLDAIDLLKTKGEKELSFDDESEDRPIYQLNLDSEIKLEDKDKNLFKKQILKNGTWYHWNTDGGILKITKDIIKKLVKNFKDGLLENVSIPLTHTNDPSMNTGEVVDLIETANGLDAICEIKDNTIAKKIKNHLIKSISASIDPNYRNKETNKFEGPVLLHAALVAEPFIKGMKNFVPLSDEFEGRPVLQFEDSEPNFYEIATNTNEYLKKLAKVVEKASGDEFEMPVDINAEKKEDKIEEKKEEEIEKKDDVKEDKEKTEKKDDVKEDKEKTEKKEEVKEDKIEEKENESDDSSEDESSESDEKDSDKTSSEDDTTKSEDSTDIKSENENVKKIKSFVDNNVKAGLSNDDAMKKAIREFETSVFQTCMNSEMEKGIGMTDSAAICKDKVNDQVNTIVKEEFPEYKSGNESKGDVQGDVDLSDAEKVYEEFLEQGKIVPAQKDEFVKLVSSVNQIELSDKSKVGIASLLKDFLSKQPKIVDFSEGGTEGGEPTEDITKENKEDDIPSDAKDFFTKRMGLSDDEAKTSWENLQELKEEREKNESTVF